MRALNRGESATAFKPALQDAKVKNEEGVEQLITAEHVQWALDAVAITVVPHWVLEIQKLWMNQCMFKLAKLTSTRDTLGAINRLNTVHYAKTRGLEENAW